jgi:hypothetical protein
MQRKKYLMSIFLASVSASFNSYSSNPITISSEQQAIVEDTSMRRMSRVPYAAGQLFGEQLAHASHHGQLKTFSFKHDGGTTIVESRGKTIEATEITETTLSDKSSSRSVSGKQSGSFDIAGNYGKIGGSFNFGGGSKSSETSTSNNLHTTSYTEISTRTSTTRTLKTHQDAVTEGKVQFRKHTRYNHPTSMSNNQDSDND